MENETPKWDFGNSILYNMCIDKPNHDDINITVDKLNIIGRTYSATIERGAGKSFEIVNVAKKIKNSEIDKLLKQIKLIEFPNEDNIIDILKVHKYFTDILYEETGLYKRSLASKYLHFHAPKVFFIYDSIAKKQIGTELNNRRFKFNTSNDVDEEYSRFVYKCLYFRDNFHKGKTPRDIDKVLLNY